MPVRFRINDLSLAVYLAVFGLTTSAWPQDDSEDSPYRPGLVATYTASGQTIARTDEIVAFDWQNASPDPRLPAGEFTAVWRGRLWARGAGSYRLACYAQGDVEIKLSGKSVISGHAAQPQWLQSQPIDLEFDYHPLEITFRRTQPNAQLALFWSGPDFRLEPIPARFLVHDRRIGVPPVARSGAGFQPAISFERGRHLATALHCAACHQDASASVPPGPALDRLSGNIHEQWLINWLVGHSASDNPAPPRRMPHLDMNLQEAEAIAAWLLRNPPQKTESKKIEQKEAKAAKDDGKSKKSKKGKSDEQPKPSAEAGERLILTRGCLACHKLGEFGESGLFGGGDLTALTTKRPADFLTRWLEDPSAINRHHRMPQFTFTADELTSLSLWAKQQSAHQPEAQARVMRAPSELISEGEKLVQTFRCASCHALTREGEAPAEPPRQPQLTASSNWNNSCAAEPRREKNQPGYRLAATDQAVLNAYYSQMRPSENRLSPQSRGHDLLTHLNCLACHQREGVDRSVVGTRAPAQRVGVPLPENDGTRSVPATYLPTLADKLTSVANSHPDLAPLVPAMTPPALNSVGDKLHDAALADAISRQGPPHRPYLLVQMPKFNLSKDQLNSLVAYFTATDRIPSGAGFQPAIQNSAGQRPTPQALLAAGPRLVTTDGLACTSCHQVGSVLPTKAPLNARGPDMSMLGQRIRREWFDRWCDNPARIVPRMEMPAVKIPVRGVLNEKIDDQLAAVWHILNTPGFEPPEPNPVRVLRLSGVPEKNERPIVIHDVFKDGDKTYLYPLVIGLPNRHNILFDLETNRLAAWWLGDTARQRTRGKYWFWEPGGKSILDPGFEHSEISVVIDGKEYYPVSIRQWPTASLLSYQSDSTSVTFPYVLRFRLPESVTSRRTDDGLCEIYVSQRVRAALSDEQSASWAFERIFTIDGSPGLVRYRAMNGSQPFTIEDEKKRTATLKAMGNTINVSGISTVLTLNSDSSFDLRPGLTVGLIPRAIFRVQYNTKLIADRYENLQTPPSTVQTAELQLAPGFVALRLPLSVDLMPSTLAWDDRGRLLFGTLKGQVFSAADSDDDGLEDLESLLIDGLPTPYGIATRTVSTLRTKRRIVNVLVKTGLMRLSESTDGRVIGVGLAATGWGATDDYHDWAVGLVPGENGEYYIALPCQQDQRSEAAAKYRGSLLKLTPPRSPASQARDQQPNYTRRFYDIEVISAGHRFPMGMARNRDGELFVTDNQGNYNPFNELNHVRKGAHFGFINALEKQSGFVPPPLTPPAINIPHPWTRSINGICFLDTPTNLPSPSRSLYGPFEGHLVGCEYDTRRLIRMSLQKIGDTYQGCAYPLSIPPDDVEKGLLGPIVCAIKPTTGELYVGEIRDSGWGASNNIGQIVKIKIEPEKLPCGIAEVRATSTGFTIDFIQPVDPAKAADIASYSIQSYRRESTPAYGGPDLDRRDEQISSVTLSKDSKRATLTLPTLRPGHVYEIQLKNLAPAGAMFHPDQAHYTLNQIPK